MRWIMSGCAILALAACDPPIPDSGAGVGFDNAAMNPQPVQHGGTALPPADAVSEETLAVLNATGDMPGDTQVDGSGIVQASPSNPAPLQLENAGLSDENDFDAVGNRRSIEDDAKRREQIAAQYQVVEATDLPSGASTGPNIVAYALNSSNPVGTRLYQRFGLNSEARYQRNCRQYPSPDQAQIDFLSRGGPEKDRRGLDPDGDGYACSWDPEPFRKALGG